VIRPEVTLSNGSSTLVAELARPPKLPLGPISGLSKLSPSYPLKDGIVR